MYPLNICTVAKKQVSAADGTVKFLYALHDGDYIESVVMKYKIRLHGLRLFQQVGCKMGCAFCASDPRRLQEEPYRGRDTLAGLHRSA